MRYCVLLVFCLAMVSFVAAQDSWVGLHHTGSLNITAGVRIDDATVCAAGSGGLILKTTNGGVNWFAYPSGVNVDLTSIHFINATRGWAAGPNAGGSVIMTTGDGGHSWTRQAQPAGFTQVMNGIYFQDANNGWVVGASGRCARTIDGGATWTQVTMPGAATFTLYDVNFSDAQNGFIVGGSTSAGYVMQSSNGGVSWSDPLQIAALPLYAVRTLDATTAVTVGNNGTIFRTSDAGATWEVRTAPPGAIRPLRGLSASGSTVAAAGDTVVIVSTNGGVTWTKKNTGLRANVFPAELLNTFVLGSGTDGWAMGDVGIIMHTTDAGDSWAYQVPAVTQAGFSVDLNGASFVSSTTGWAVGANSSPGGSVILATNDGGLTWARQQPPAGFTQAMNDVYFRDASTGWMVGASGRCARTIDGGGTWSQVTMPSAATFTLYGVAFRDASNGLIVGGSTSAGYVMQSSNGGVSWTDPVQIAALPLYDVQYVDATTAVTVGNNGTIYRTTDDGATWDVRTAPPGAIRPLRGISAVGNSVFAAGDTVVIVSTNGGSTWTKRATGLRANIFPAELLNGITMASPTHGWAYGEPGIILKTEDAGATWVPEPFPYPTKSVLEMVYTPGVVLFVGSGGIMGRNATPVISDVGEHGEGTPLSFRLEQNFPNPFNPETHIRYTLQYQARVTLTVFDLLGREVVMLEDGVRAPGTHDVLFNGAGLASGIYFYTLNTGGVSQTRRSVLLR